MTEFLSVITSTGDADKKMALYPVPPCDGYLDNVEIVNCSGLANTESIITMLGNFGNVNDVPTPADGTLKAFPDTHGFSLHSGSYDTFVTAPDSVVQRKFFGKKRFYLKAGKPFTHFAYFHVADVKQWSIIRARFNPQKNSIVQFRAKEVDIEAQSDLNSLVDVAYNMPLGLKSGALGAIHVTVKETSTSAAVYGNIEVRHIRNNTWTPDVGDGTETDHTALRGISGDFHSLDRQILAIRPFAAGASEVKTGSFTFPIPTSVHEGDLITIYVVVESGAADINTTLEISGRASGFSSYQYVMHEGTHVMLEGGAKV